MTEPRKRGPRTAAEKEGVSMQARGPARVYVEIRLEVPLAAGIELIQAAAKAQENANKPGTQWQPPSTAAATE